MQYYERDRLPAFQCVLMILKIMSDVPLGGIFPYNHKPEHSMS